MIKRPSYGEYVYACEDSLQTLLQLRLFPSRQSLRAPYSELAPNCLYA